MTINEADKHRIKDLFRDLSDAAIEKLFSHATLSEYPPRHVIFEQGDYADKLYVLLSGQVGVYVELGDDMYRIDKINHGCFGEIALLLSERQTRTATIMTGKPTRLLEINRQAFQQLTVDMPALSMEMARVVIKRMVAQDKLAITKLKASSDSDTVSPLPSVKDIRKTVQSMRMMLVTPHFGIPHHDAQYETDIFMVMPFRDELKSVYEDHIKKAAEALKLSIKRGDDFFTSRVIMDEIWAATNSARLIIADCTDRNPNVFYELGIAHTLGKPTIILTQKEEDIPFDIRRWRYITYQDSLEGLAALEQELKTAIKKVLQL